MDSLTRANVVLVQTRVGDMDQFRERPTPPTGLLCAATFLDAQVEVRLVDQRVEADWRTSLARALDPETVAVGLTAMTGAMIGNGLDVAAEVRRARPELPIVWGGIHASLLPEQTVSHPLVDYVVEGEGEVSFDALVKALRRGERGHDVPGVWYKEGNGTGHTPRGPLLDLGTLPPIPYHLVDMERYLGTFRGKRMFFYQSSRGCPFQCTYCYNTVFNQGKWRARPATKVLEEIDDLRRRFDFSAIYFLDDDFFIHRPRAMELLRGLKERGIATVLQGVDIQTIHHCTDEDLAFLEQSGLERISVGIESGTDRVRSSVLDKWGTVAQVRTELGRLKDRKFTVLCSFIIGLPGETAEETENTVNFALATLRSGSNFRVPQLYNYTPMPGTQLCRRLTDDGFRFPFSLEGWSDWEYDFNMTNPGFPESKDRLERMVFLSKFVDEKMDDFETGERLLKAAYALYKPIARARLKHRILWPLPERSVYRLLKDHH